MNQTVAIARLERPLSAAPAAAGFAEAVRAEWTKLRTTPGTAWILTAVALLTVAISAAVAAAAKCPTGGACATDTTKISLTGIEAGQALVAVLAVLAITGEYSTGMIRTTFTAMPRRVVVLAAKACVLIFLVLPAAVIAVAGSLAAGRLMLPANGFTATRGYVLVSLAHGPTVRAALGTVLYLVLIGLLSLAIATMVRDSAVATGAVLAVLYIVPIMVLFLGGEPAWQSRLERYSPATAGLAIEDTTGLRHLPIGPWGGLAVLALWAAGALLAAAAMLRLRDA